MIRLSHGATLAALMLSTSLAAAQDGTTVRIGLEIPASIVNVPMLIAADRLAEEGVTVEWVEFQSPETMTLALQNGEVDFIGTSAGTAFSAIDAGFAGRAFLGMSASDFLMVAKADLTTCESLDGRNVAVQSREGTTGVLTLRWFADACPDARPNILIVPGSENRVAGLLAGQLDASPIDSQNTAQLMAQRPGEFGTIASFSEDARIVASVYFASDAWLESAPEAARTVAETYVEVLNALKADPAEFIARTQALLSETDPEVVAGVAEGWLERDVFIPIWGVSAEPVEAAIEFYATARPYQRITGPADVATDEFVSDLSVD